MTTPMLMSQHLTEETLAAYVDDRLDSDTRQPVTDHLASCGECREIVLMTSAYQAQEESSVVRGNFGARQWMTAVAGLAAAAVIVVIVQPNLSFLKNYRETLESSWEWTTNLTAKMGTKLRSGSDTDDLVAASRNLRERPSAGRLGGDWTYGAQPSTMRGGSDEVNDDLGAKAELLQLRVDLEDEKSPDLHVLGLARLLTAEKNATDINAAVTNLYAAYREASGEERDSIAVDLAAALIAHGRWSQPDQNYARALELSNDVLKRYPKKPEALWNRAIALESLNRDYEAARAWVDYLNVDPSSQWAKEAERRKANLVENP